MSSIYKKGRDGYFYYQTYIYNPESGKKNKRIFHSLGTKNRVEAEEQKIQLDIKYNQLKRQNKHVPFYQKLSGYQILPKVIIIFLAVLFFTTNPKDFKTDNLNSTIITNEIIIRDDTLKNLNQNHISQADISSNKIIGLKNKKLSSVPNTKKELKVDDIKKNITAIPDYNIVRVERFSDSFKQGKISVTISENINDDIQRSICQVITKRFNEFSNIIICLYADNIIGNDLAMGKKDNVSVQDKKRFWLAMYTYNPVEGEYFDGYPSGYLGFR